MGIITSAQLLSQWKVNQFKPVYLFAEQNSFEKERHLSFLIQILFPGGLTPFNHDIISFPGSTTAQDIINSALMLPFLGDKRLVQVKDLHQATNSQLVLLAESLSIISESTILILETTQPKKEVMKSQIGKKIGACGDIIFFWRPRIQDLSRMVMQKVADAGKTITPEAARFIVEDIGDDQTCLMNEVDKLLLYCTDNKIIGLKEAAEICGQTMVYNLFDLQETLQVRNTKKSIDVLGYLLRERTEPVKILHSLYQMYRRLLLAKLMLEEKKYTKEDIIPALGINVYFDKHFFSDLNYFEKNELIEYLMLIAETDEAIKTGKTDPESALAVLILRLSGFEDFVKLQRQA